MRLKSANCRRFRPAHRLPTQPTAVPRNRDADEQAGPRAGDVGGGEDRRERRDGAVDEPDQAGLDPLKQPLLLRGLPPALKGRISHRLHYYYNSVRIRNPLQVVREPEMS